MSALRQPRTAQPLRARRRQYVPNTRLRRPPADTVSNADVARGLARLEGLLTAGLERLQETNDATNRRIDKANDRITSESDNAARARDQLNEKLDTMTQLFGEVQIEVARLRLVSGEPGSAAPEEAPEVDTLTAIAKRRFAARPRATMVAFVLAFVSFVTWLADTGPKVLKTVAAFWRTTGSADF